MSNINNGFKYYRDGFMMVYLDAIHVCGKSWDEHVLHVKFVLGRVGKPEIYAKLQKESLEF